LGAAVGGATFGLMNNPRTILHPWNTLKTTFSGNVNKMFADVKVEGTKLYELYNNLKVVDGKKFTGGYELVSEAYARMHKLESLKNPKLGWFRRSLSKQPEALKQAKTPQPNTTNMVLKLVPTKQIQMAQQQVTINMDVKPVHLKKILPEELLNMINTVEKSEAIND
jgi:hypothetical protein